MSLIKAILIMSALWGATLYMMFTIASCEAKAVMGAPDQTPAEKRLSECQNEEDCKKAYDEVWGEGAWDKMEKDLGCGTDSDCAEAHDEKWGDGAAATMERVMRECGASSPGGHCAAGLDNGFDDWNWEAFERFE